jgi:hemerythrin-like metal-binding protein
MTYWNWDHSYELGIKHIDRANRRIARQINALHKAIVSGDRPTCAQIIANTIYSMHRQFALEEGLMRRAGYDGSEMHAQKHVTHLKNLERIHADFKSGADVAGMFMAELQIWMSHHLRRADKHWAPCAIEHLLSLKLGNTGGGGGGMVRRLAHRVKLFFKSKMVK